MVGDNHHKPSVIRTIRARFRPCIMWIRAAPLKRRYFDEKVLGNGGCKNLCWYLCWYMTSTSKPKHYTATVSEHCLIDPTPPNSVPPWLLLYRKARRPKGFGLFCCLLPPLQALEPNFLLVASLVHGTTSRHHRALTKRRASLSSRISCRSCTGVGSKPKRR